MTAVSRLNRTGTASRVPAHTRPSRPHGRPSGKRTTTIAYGTNHAIQMPWVRTKSNGLAGSALGSAASASCQVPCALMSAIAVPAAVSQVPTQLSGSWRIAR